MEAPIYNQKGKEVGTVALPEKVFAVPRNADLLRQVLLSYAANARTPVAHTKDRSEVRGGGRKPWKQKGTGRARHGSRRSPLWSGGGITHGPRSERDYSVKMNVKMKRKALYVALSEKARDSEVLFVDSVSFAEPKTKYAKDTLAALSGIKGFEKLSFKKKNAAVIAVPKKDGALERSFGNFGNVEIAETRNLNAPVVAKYKYVIIVGPKESIAVLEGKMKSSSKAKS